MIESLIPKNKRFEGIDNLDAVMVPASEKQKHLTKEWILPNREAIINDIQILRKEADMAIKGSKKDAHRNYTDSYPVGRCLEINRYVYKKLLVKINNPTMPGIKAIRKFIKEGGIIKPIWVIQNKKFFQNAIQIGESILDVAEDTYDPAKSPVSIYDNSHEGGYEVIRSIEQFADVAEEYWGARAYPNIYMPALAPMFPVILRKPVHNATHPKQQLDQDGLFLEGGQEALFNLNLMSIDENEDLFKLTNDFLFRGKYSKRRLPKEAYANLLEMPWVKTVAKNTDQEFFVSDDAERAAEYLKAHFYNHIESTKDLYEHLQAILYIHNEIIKGWPMAVFPSKFKDNEQE